MKNHIHILIIIISLFIGLDLSGQVKNIPEVSGLIIDPKIKNEVARYIIDSSYENYTNGPMQFAMYQNRLFLELYQNDKLVISMKDSAPVSLIFKSFFYWSHDTLSIDGAFGMWEGMGFTIRIVNNKATLYNMLSADEFPFMHTSQTVNYFSG